MREFQSHERRRPRRLLTVSWPVLILLFLALILVGRNVVSLYRRERVVAEEGRSLERELALLETRRRELEAQVASFETERGIETAIRERFGMVKEGEKVINLVGEATVAQTVVTSPESWWRKIVVWFENKAGLVHPPKVR